LIFTMRGEGSMMNRSGTGNSIAVIGAGAVGAVVAALVSEAGYNVEIVCKHADLAERIRTEGIHLTGAKGEHRVAMPAVADVAELKETKDIIFLATKATDMLEVAEELLPFLKDTSVVVSLQNGICEDALGGIIGRDRIVGCVVGWGSTMHSPGEIEMTSTGEFVIGTIDNRPDPRLRSIAEMLNTVAPVEISSNIMGSLYAKLIINSCITSLGAVCGLYLGEMLSKKKIRAIFIEIMREAMAVANAMELRVEEYGGKINYYTLLRGAGFFDNLKRHLLIRMIGFKYRRLKSSSLQSLERGKPTEIDFLNGYIVAKGEEYTVSVPVNRRIVQMIKEIEEKKREISPDNFNDPVFSSFT